MKKILFTLVNIVGEIFIASSQSGVLRGNKDE